MRQNLLLALVFSFSIIFNADAAFPVKKEVSPVQSQVDEKVQSIDVQSTQVFDEKSELSEREVKKMEKKKARFNKRLEKLKNKEKGAYGSLTELIILVLLWVFLGWIAGHRWYARKPIIWNLIYILTLGGFGIWAIVDLIFILTGNFM